MTVATDGPSALETQSALRRVAERVAQGDDRAVVLRAVVAEARTLLGVDFAALLSYGPDGAAFIEAVDHGPADLRVGERAPRIPEGLVTQVLDTGRPARVESYADLPAGEVDRLRELGIVAGAAAPVSVDGRLWGVLAAMAADGPVPRGLEHDLADFADLAATAIASAQARTELRELADEQTALRRVAELVARGTSQATLFAAVAREAAGLIGNEATTLVRFVGERRFVILATHGGPAPVGTTVDVPPDDEGVVAEILRTGQAARLDGYDTRSGRLYARRDFGVQSSVAVPIVVDDRMWGMLGVVTSARRLPEDAELRLQQFARLVAAALANAQVRAEIIQLAEQQAALRRVAELAARDRPAREVLHAVAAEASRLFGVAFTTVLRYEPDGATEIVALNGAPAGMTVGMRAAGGGDGAVPQVWRTRRAARIDDLAGVSGGWAQVVHALGFSSTAAVPILIQDELWGTLVVVSRDRALSASIQDQLTSFAEIAGTAISAAQAWHDLSALADEQTAMRRVSELVAHGAELEEVFAAIDLEASQLLGMPTRLQRLPPVGGPDPAGADLSIPVHVEGRVWGTLSAYANGSPLPAEASERLQQFTELAAAAIANAENKAQLTASRARVVATADETRRRLQRDVHDGAQQRLVQTIITLRVARDRLAEDSSVREEISEALFHAERANAELRDLVRGILPHSLTDGGLRTGLESLLDDLPLAVQLAVDVPRLPADTETTAYFVVAEALTNVVKHAHASHAGVDVHLEDEVLLVEIADDGAGGADFSRGTGLMGLSDRVAAADGTLTVRSGPSGTTVRASLPCSALLPSSAPLLGHPLPQVSVVDARVVASDVDPGPVTGELGAVPGDDVIRRQRKVGDQVASGNAYQPTLH